MLAQLAWNLCGENQSNVWTKLPIIFSAIGGAVVYEFILQFILQSTQKWLQFFFRFKKKVTLEIPWAETGISLRRESFQYNNCSLLENNCINFLHFFRHWIWSMYCFEKRITEHEKNFFKHSDTNSTIIFQEFLTLFREIPSRVRPWSLQTFVKDFIQEYLYKF